MAGILTPAQVFEACDRIMAGPLVWGLSDCTAAACDVFADLHGIDPMAPLRGAYAGPGAARRIIRQAGGMLALGQALAARAGLVECHAVPGAIGILPNARRHVAAICIEPGKWAAKTADGFAVTDGALTAWRV
ncbi:DUF6950 family protein [Gemmobacter denitrificans]|uniref:DUF6950 domain-containing protein n=1 Tax=Gemmobacter denitrificans TaxID=3123040 RepID=A0ABU8BQX2_9RHOB